MTLPFLHPRFASLVAFAADELAPRRHRRLAAHLRNCFKCQATLRFLRRLETSTATLPQTSPPPTVLDRALQARAAGQRVILFAALPDGTEEGASHSRPNALRVRWVAAAAIAMLAWGLSVLGPGSHLDAVAQESELILAPEKPGPGNVIHARYRPAPGMFSNPDSLILRARLRARHHEMYNGGVPVRSMAMLRRGKDGEYRADFTLPDSVVFAALAVEDAAASRVDTYGGKLWEVLTYGDDGRPIFESLEQRMNDMMGRSWEEGYATARRLTELFPASISAWSFRKFFETSLFGEAAADSLSRSYQARVARLLVDARQQPTLPEGEIGAIFYQAYLRVLHGGSAADSAELNYWWERLQRQYPRHPEVAQRIAIDLNGTSWQHPRFILDSLERVYPRFIPITGSGRNINSIALQAAAKLGDDTAYRRWVERSNAGAADSLYRVALMLASRPRFRSEGVRALRHLVAASERTLGASRGLEITAENHRRRVEDSRRRVYAELGRALVAEGEVQAGRDTLLLAARGGWDPALFRDIAAALLAAGDSGEAFAIRVKLAVDPRTASTTADSIVSEARGRLGSAGWDSAATSARGEMHTRFLERSIMRSPRGYPQVAASGVIQSLSDVLGSRPGVVIFWSRYCGNALVALPRIIKVSEQMRESGTPVAFVVTDPQSAEIDMFLAERGVSKPVFYDVRGTATIAFSTFGTPSYYVLDSRGRIRFDQASSVEELLAQVSALAAAGE